MKSTAILRYIRIAPRKVRLVADLVRGKNVALAQSVLRFTSNKSARPVLKLLNSAVANATQKFQIEPSNLFIAKITVDEGPKLKRARPRARGQSYEIQKKTSHITIMLDELTKGVALPKVSVEKTHEIKEVKTETGKTFTKPAQEGPKPKQSLFMKAPRMFRRKSI